MAKKAAKVDELMELLKDDKVSMFLVERLETSLAPALEIMIEKKIDIIIAKIMLKIDPIIDKKINNLMKDKLEIMQSKQTHLEEQNAHLRGRLSQLEVDARSNNLMIHGVEELGPATMSRQEAEKEAINSTLRLCTETLGLSLTENDISTAYRLPKKSIEKHRPLVATFASLQIRNLVIKSRTQLRKTRIYINDHLTPDNALLFAKARALVKEGKASSTWTAGGWVFLQTTTDQGHKPTKITSIQDLTKLTSTSLILGSASVAVASGT